MSISTLRAVKTKSGATSVALLVLSLLRFYLGETDALAGIQEAIFSLIPLIIRSAMHSDTTRSTDAVMGAIEEVAAERAKAPEAGGA